MRRASLLALTLGTVGALVVAVAPAPIRALATSKPRFGIENPSDNSPATVVRAPIRYRTTGIGLKLQMPRDCPRSVNRNRSEITSILT